MRCQFIATINADKPYFFSNYMNRDMHLLFLSVLVCPIALRHQNWQVLAPLFWKVVGHQAATLQDLCSELPKKSISIFYHIWKLQ